MKTTNLETTKQVLGAMGYPAEKVELAAAALEGDVRASPSQQDNEPLMTPGELRARLHVSETTLWRLQLPFIRVGSRKRYLWSQIQNYFNQKRETPHEVQ